MRTPPSSASARRIRGASGTSRISTRRCPLWASRSWARLSRNHTLANSVTPPSVHSILSASGALLMRLTLRCSLTGGPRCTHVQDIKNAGAQRGCRTDRGQRHEYAFPAVGAFDTRHGVAGQHAADVANAVDDSRGGGTGLLAAEVECKSAAEIRIGPEQAQRDDADHDQGKHRVGRSRVYPRE